MALLLIFVSIYLDLYIKKMDPISFISSLFCTKPNRHNVDIIQGATTMKELSLRDYRVIEASDIFLKEIELLVNENTDFNNDKHKIQSLLQKFEDIELELKRVNESNVFIRDVSKSKLFRINLNKQEYSKEIIKQIPDLMSEFEDSKRIVSLISEIQERRRKVEQRFKELGIKFYFK
jgi:hypothetical protein